ncbi:hypothetical protein DSCO28_57740 [Desulfosarcina ovata subsp. sediminis]|uniref:Uncharacterized protein n=1 Tax=Desulfosarcina ovata subsp. sediminis TaxID=885957 RepID=A0A5K7ZY79_9BACT|nr:hypothetical protein [Desulfosarcina ovata]BBO85208.1 hypothetical protein DSCO28_57740 [Desulfosarcina ovata subsp. sediminis]
MYSKRFDWNAAPHPLGTALAERMSRGEAILDLTDANPTRGRVGDILLDYWY